MRCKFASSYEARGNGRIQLRILIAPDKFKDSLTASQASAAISAGFREVGGSEFELVEFPLADGGEGTAEVLARSGRLIEARTVDALERPITARFGLLDDGTAVVEMAEASGLWRLQAAERDPAVTSTYGTGILIREALETGARRIIVGAGGSATVDAGLGALSALGAKVLDGSRKPLRPIGANLERVATLEAGEIDQRLLTNVSLVVACDVPSPLYGPAGAARQFARQKGASRNQVEMLERGLMHIAGVYEETLGPEVAEDSGAGAAGGLAAGLLAAFGADLVDGFGLIAEMTKLDEALRETDLVVTGEGSFDFSQGKVVAGLARRAQRVGIPVVVIAGSTTIGDESLKRLGIEMQVSIERLAGTVDEAKRHPEDYLTVAGREVAALLLDSAGEGQ